MRFRGEKFPVNMEYENNKNGSLNTQKNRHNTFTRDGLDEEIQTNDRKNTIGQEQPLRTPDIIQ